jgi:tetratricopeptide (TPR) repeat protein
MTLSINGKLILRDVENGSARRDWTIVSRAILIVGDRSSALNFCIISRSRANAMWRLTAFAVCSFLLLCAWGCNNRPTTTTTKPRDFTEAGFREAIERQLTPQEARLVVNPLESDPAMRRWALAVTKGATNDFQKAQILFTSMIGRSTANASTLSHPATAREVYYAWNTPDALFGCQDLAFVFEALARECGLNAYHAFVELDSRGVYVLHGCAAIFFGGKLILVDPAYSEFDIHHRRFTVLNDLETAGLYLSGKGGINECEAAYKLAPGLSIVQQSLFDALTSSGRWNEAEKLAVTLKQKDPGSPIALAVESKVSEKHGNLQEAVRYLNNAVDLAPETPQFHLRLASLYVDQGRWVEARLSFESAARYAIYASARDVALAGVAYTDAMQCVAKGDWQGALKHCDQAVVLRPDFDLHYSARAVVKQNGGDLPGALSDYSKVIELSPNDSQSHFARGNLEYLTGDPTAASADFERAVKLDPTSGGYAMLAYVQYDRHEFTEALANFQKARKAGPVDDYVHFRIWLSRSHLGQADSANRDLLSYLTTREKNRSNAWSSTIGKYLLGKLSEKELFAAADGDKVQQASQRCEAWFYVASRNLLSGDELAAKRCFERCLEARIPTLMESISASTELKRLDSQNKK